MPAQDIPPKLAKRHDQWFYAAWGWMLADYAIKVLAIISAGLTPYLRHYNTNYADAAAITATICTSIMAVVNPGRTANLFWAASRIVDTARRKYEFEEGTIKQVNVAFTRGEAMLQGWVGVPRSRKQKAKSE